MSAGIVSTRIDRVVVPLDASSEYQTAIDTAARLAARLDAKLHAIFVEDEDVLQAASLSFVRHVAIGATSVGLTVEQVERSWHASAGRVRGYLAGAAVHYRVEWSFAIVRGDPAAALAGIGAGDLVVAGGLSRPLAGYFHLEWRWWRSIEATPGVFLLARRAWAATGPVAILLPDRSAAAVRLLEAAARLAEARGGGLTVIAGAELTVADDFEDWLRERLAGFALRVVIETAPPETTAVQARLVALDCGLIAVGAGDPESPRTLFARVACDVLVVH